MGTISMRLELEGEIGGGWLTERKKNSLALKLNSPRLKA
jgi:hypothetical protein